MNQIITAVPNISEGRDAAFIDRLKAALEIIPGLMVLDVAMDQARNRTVLSLTGSREAIFEGGFKVYEESLKHVDMRKHQGEYPRIGAVDAFPFVAVKNAPLETVVAWSREFAQAVGERFNLPVYLFGEAALTPQRRDIEVIREGEYEGFAEKMKDPAWTPDFGPGTLPADSGATMIGARYPLVNLKAYLGTGNKAAAEWAAHTLSSPTTGMPNVKFYPGLDHTRGMALLNITIGNYRATPLYRVLEALKTELRRFGTSICQVEMIGLVPQGALIDSALHYLHVNEFSDEHLMESKLQQVVDQHLERMP